ncbi:MAG: HPF/RaiA family ribosome-associated protein [Gemmatimonadetes bacterium]|nr:HPF/RaiA family ribosome-associated protein [Gemmatimonadota bacterium]
MEISINARHCSVPESIRNQSLIRLQRLLRFSPMVLSATAVFSAEATTKLLDIRLTVKGGAPILGRGQGPTLRTALDRAVARLETQLKRHNPRHRSRRPRPDQVFRRATTA